MEEGRRNLILIIILLTCLMANIFLVYIVYKDIEILKQDPLGYGIRSYEFSGCSCFQDGRIILFDEDGLVEKDSSTQLNISFEIENGSG